MHRSEAMVCVAWLDIWNVRMTASKEKKALAELGEETIGN